MVPIFVEYSFCLSLCVHCTPFKEDIINFGNAPYGNSNITNVSQYSTVSYSCDDYDEFKAPIEVLELVLWLKPQCYFIFNFFTCSSKSVLWKFWGKQENREQKENPTKMALSFPI